MLLKLKKEVRKQVKRLYRQAEKLYKEFGEAEASVEYDTNEVLIRMDKLENELKALREAVNHAKRQKYLERVGNTNRQKSLSELAAGEGKYIVKKPVK